MELDTIKKIISEVFNVDVNEITLNTKFIDDLGADSLDLFQIITSIEEAFSIEIDYEDVEKIVTVGDAVEKINQAIS